MSTTNKEKISNSIIQNIVVAIAFNLAYCVIMGSQIDKDHGGFPDLFYGMVGAILALIVGLVLNTFIKSNRKEADYPIITISAMHIVIFIVLTKVLEQIPFFSQLIP